MGSADDASGGSRDAAVDSAGRAGCSQRTWIVLVKFVRHSRSIPLLNHSFLPPIEVQFSDPGGILAIQT